MLHTRLTGGISARSRIDIAAVTSTFAAVEALARFLEIELKPIIVNASRDWCIDIDVLTFLSPTGAEDVCVKVGDKFGAQDWPAVRYRPSRRVFCDLSGRHRHCA